VHFVAPRAALALASHAFGGGRSIELLGALCLVVGSVLERCTSKALPVADGAIS
jgi:hypothetical protein